MIDSAGENTGHNAGMVYREALYKFHVVSPDAATVIN
jgi:hypothetical protein